MARGFALCLSLVVALSQAASPFTPLTSHPDTELELSYFLDRFEEEGDLGEDWGISLGTEVVSTSCGIVNDNEPARTVAKLNGGADRSMATPPLDISDGAFVQFATYMGDGDDCDAVGPANELVLEVVNQAEITTEVLRLNVADYQARWGQTFVTQLTPAMLGPSVRVRVRQDGVQPGADLSTPLIDDFMVGCPAPIVSEGSNNVANTPFNGPVLFTYSPTGAIPNGPGSQTCNSEPTLMFDGPAPRVAYKRVAEVGPFTGGGTASFDMILDCNPGGVTYNSINGDSNQGSFGWVDGSGNNIPMVTPSFNVFGGASTPVSVPLSSQFLDALEAAEPNVAFAFFQNTVAGSDQSHFLVDNFNLIDYAGSPGPAGLAFGFEPGVNASVPSFNEEYPEGITVMAWIQPQASGSGDEDLTVLEVPGQWALQLAPRDSSAVFSPQFVLQTDEPSLTVMTGEGVSPNKWVHVTFTYAEGVVNAYYEGEQVEDSQLDRQEPASGPIASPGTDGLVIGGVSCLVDEVRVYNKALSASRIAWGWQSIVKEEEDGLVGYWRLDSTCPTFEDRSGNDHTGVAPLAVRRVVSSARVASSLDLGLLSRGGLITLSGMDVDSVGLTVNLNELPEIGKLFTVDADGNPDQPLDSVSTQSTPLVTPLTLYYQSGIVNDISGTDRLAFSIIGQREGDDGVVVIRYWREGPLWWYALGGSVGVVLFVIVPGVFFGTKLIARRRTRGATELGGEEDAKALKKLLKEEEKKERQKARERQKMKKGGAGPELKRMKDGSLITPEGRVGSRKQSASGPTGVAGRRGNSPQRLPRGSTGRRQSGGRRQGGGGANNSGHTLADLQNQLVKPEFGGLIALLQTNPGKLEALARDAVTLTLAHNTHTLFVESVMRSEMKSVSMEGSAQSTQVATTVVAAYMKTVGSRFLKDKFGGMVRTFAKAPSFEADHEAWVEAGKQMFQDIVTVFPEAPAPVRHPLSVMFKAVESLFPGEGHTVVALALLVRTFGSLLKDPVAAGFMNKPPGDDGARNLGAIAKFLAVIASTENSNLPSALLKSAAEAERPSLQAFVQKLTVSGGSAGSKVDKPSTKDQAKALESIHKGFYAKWKEIDASMRGAGKIASMRELRDILVHCPEPAGTKRPTVLTTAAERRGSSPSKTRRPSSNRPLRSNSRSGPKRL